VKTPRRGPACFIAIAASILAVWCAALPVGASTIRLMSGGRELPLEYSPVLTAQGFMVPVGLASLFGGSVDAADGTFVVQRAGQTAELIPGVAVARVGAVHRELVPAPVEVDGDLYVPLRFLADFLGLRISWDLAANTLDLSPWTSALGGRTAGTRGAGSAPAASAPGETAESGPPVSASLAVPGGRGSAEAPRLSFSSGPVASGSVSAAVSRLLEQLEGRTGVEFAWLDLERATGVRLTPVKSGGVWEYRLEGISPARITTALLVDPPRLIVDLAGVPGSPLNPFVTGDPLAPRVRGMEFEGRMRLVFDLAESVGHRIEEDGDGARLVLYRPLSRLGLDVSPTGGRIALEVPGETTYKISRLAEPERLVLDLYDTSLTTPAAVYGPFEGPVKQVRVAQFQPHITRLVLDVAAATPVDVEAGEDGLALVWGDRVESVAYRVVSPREFHVGVNAPAGAQVRAFRLTHPDRLVMDVVGMRLKNPLKDEVFLEGPVSRLRVSQFDDQTVRIVADLRHHVQYALASEQGRAVLVMREPLLTGRTLTVDAGHGGHDGGAIGVRSGILEKDVNLDIALRLEALLKGAQAVVHMTRVDDTFVDLWTRADLANETRSDVLVSIHANSSASSSSTARGTETYVRMGEPESERLGIALQGSLTSALSTVDRGVRPNRYLVVRRARMPAALVEVAFLAHPDEEGLLAEGWFRQRAAEGIYNGLLRYFHPDDEIKDRVDLSGAADAPWHTLEKAEVSGGPGAAP